MLINVSLSTDFPAEWWIDFTTSEREQYINDHPKSRYVELHMYSTKIANSMYDKMDEEDIENIKTLAAAFRAKRKGQLKRAIWADRLSRVWQGTKMIGLVGSIVYSILKFAALHKAVDSTKEKNKKFSSILTRGAIKTFLGYDIDSNVKKASDASKKVHDFLPDDAKGLLGDRSYKDEKEIAADYMKSAGGVALIAYLSKGAVGNFKRAGERIDRNKEILKTLSTSTAKAAVIDDLNVVVDEITQFIRNYAGDLK